MTSTGSGCEWVRVSGVILRGHKYVWGRLRGESLLLCAGMRMATRKPTSWPLTPEGNRNRMGAGHLLPSHGLVHLPGPPSARGMATKPPWT